MVDKGTEDDSSDAICSTFTGNPPYSIPRSSSRYAAANREEYDRGEALTAGQIVTGGRAGSATPIRSGAKPLRPRSVAVV